MVTLKVLLFSILRREYEKNQAYDVRAGIRVVVDSPISVSGLCGLLNINAGELALVTINGIRCKDISTMLRDHDEVGMHPPFPSGG